LELGTQKAKLAAVKGGMQHCATVILSLKQPGTVQLPRSKPTLDWLVLTIKPVVIYHSLIVSTMI